MTSAHEFDQHQANNEKRSVALSSVLAAVFLTVVKLIVGLLTGSLGILSEAAHSGLDLAAAIMTFFAVGLSGQPADQEHTYGHGKIENLSALFETLLLLVTCVWIIYEAIQRLFFKHVEVKASIWAFLIMIISIGVDASRSRALSRVAKKYNSQALEADALHFSTDIWSSAVVIVGLLLVRLSELLDVEWLAKADTVAAVGVAGIVIYVSVQLGRKAINDLLDAIPPDLRDDVLDAARVPGIIDVKQVRIRRSGPEYFVDVTITVARELALERAHDTSDEIESAVREVLPEADVVVHVEPVSLNSEGVLTFVRLLAARQGLRAHAIHITQAQGVPSLELHLEVSDDLSLEEAHEQASAFEDTLRQELPGFSRIVTHIEPTGDSSLLHRRTMADETQVVQALRDFTEERQIECRPHDLHVHSEGEKLFVSFHCTIDPGSPITDAHMYTDQVEQFLRHRIPNLGRVMIHVEPPEEE